MVVFKLAQKRNLKDCICLRTYIRTNLDSFEIFGVIPKLKIIQTNRFVFRVKDGSIEYTIFKRIFEEKFLFSGQTQCKGPTIHFTHLQKAILV